MFTLTTVAGVISAVKSTQTHRIFHHPSFVIKTSNSAYTVSSTCNGESNEPCIASAGGAVNTAQKVHVLSLHEQSLLTSPGRAFASRRQFSFYRFRQRKNLECF